MFYLKIVIFIPLADSNMSGPLPAADNKASMKLKYIKADINSKEH